MNNASGAHRTDSNATNSWNDINLKEEGKSESYETSCLQKRETQYNTGYAKEDKNAHKLLSTGIKTYPKTANRQHC